jgi:2-oxo-4-hydroxy-4-carboxy-5-ureidoimidazoline decarboxylase
MSPLTLREINALDRDDFVARLGSIFESSPWIAAEAWREQPFSSIERLHETMCAVMYNAGPEQKLALIRAHPDLVGRAALAGTLSAESKGEQASAGLDRLSAEEVAEFRRRNDLYREKFGFPFVICARENKKESILAGFETRLGHSPDQEIATALAEIAKIARLRLADAFEYYEL